MRRVKKITIYIGIVVVVLVLFRGPIYRFIATYTKVAHREYVPLTNKRLIATIHTEINDKNLTIQEVIALSHAITSNHLTFTFNKTPSNPNLVCDKGQANCIGYSALFNSVGHYIAQKKQMKQYEFKHLVGEIDVFGYNIHALFSSSFFKNHDFNQIKNLETGKIFFVDPSLRDYFKIDFVTARE